MSERVSGKVAITGLGIFSPIGIGEAAFAGNLQAGVTGIGPTALEPSAAMPGGIGGEVREFTEEAVKKQYLQSQRKSIKVMCREIQLGAAAALQAVESAGLKDQLSQLDHERMGVEYGANLMFFNPESMADSAVACKDESGEFDFNQWGSKGLGSMEPLWMLRYLPNMPACHIAIFVDARGPNNSVTLDEASPGVAITEALNIIQRGAADVMLVGGTGTRIHPVRAIHARLYDQLGYDESEPNASCRPFDARRTGQVVSESAACLVLETEEHARARGAKIYGYILGGASSCVAAPDGAADVKQAVLNACRGALRRAGVEISQIGHINAHGVGAPESDQAEAQALAELMGTESAQIPVTGLKGYFGNAGAATGFLELIGSLLAVQRGVIPRTLNCGQPDPALPIQIVGETDRPVQSKLFLNVNFTRAGQASAVVAEAATPA